MNNPRPIQKLPQDTARKIAAGEVIDRPAAIVRELMDNAIDANAKYITVEIEEGGIAKIRVRDDGFGMTKNDLAACAYPHATSKIVTDQDLLELNTLGFRGEALASIAAVSRLEITSIRQGEIAHKLEAFGTTEHKVVPTQWNKGTVVESTQLFENFPARRVFLKKPQAEAKLCKQSFIEKAMPWTSVGFKFIQDGKVKFDFQPDETKAERFVHALELSEPVNFFHEVSFQDNAQGFEFTLVLGNAEIRRSDKRNIYIFVNGRRIWEYGLIQAIEYGGQGYFPNGTYPVAALFLNVDSKLVDFNIHPAKKEVRFKDLSPIHHAISTATRNFYKDSSIAELVKGASALSDETPSFSESFSETEDFFKKPEKNAFQSGFSEKPARNFSDSFKAYQPQAFQEKFHAERTYKPPYEAGTHSNYSAEYSAPDNKPAVYSENMNSAALSVEDYAPEYEENSFHYYGTALGVFMLVEMNNALYFIDQHAAHERILFNQFMKSIGSKQKLLFPYIIETESEADDEYLESIKDELEKAGFELKNDGGGTWQIESVCTKWSGTEEDLKKDLLEKRIAPNELIRSIAARASCRAAVKDGTILDSKTAEALAKEALQLEDKHCPHGRPILTAISKEQFFNMVRRTE
ncbi:MAG: DNA mismatch repair endonuclease MutL [Spirochaetaceae bacterium]|nr:DNA mismatch repair endonuclease MutL [Spirochaetaceae bacterium]